MISLDTETTGLDIYHGCLPFLVTVCNEQYQNQYWEWDVDPLTRIPKIVESDIDQLAEAINDEDIAFINATFDIRVLSLLRKSFRINWNWERTHDIGLSSHLLASNHRHNLSTQSIEYLGVDIQPFEDDIALAVRKARAIVKEEYPYWKIAREGMPELPSCKDGGKRGDAETGKVWKNDMWLPRAIALHNKWPRSHPWWTVTSRYANADSATTLAVHIKHQRILKKRNLVAIYKERLKLLPVMYKIQTRGVTNNNKVGEELETEFTEETKTANANCVKIAKYHGYALIMPKGGNNTSLREFVFKTMNLPVVVETDGGQPSLDKYAIEEYQITLPQESSELAFINSLSDSRKASTHVRYIQNYRKFYISQGPCWSRLHPSLNPTGSDTLRWSSSNPNSQNVSKRGKYNLRRMFCPAPGREWWSEDAKNIELRIPAYESGEQELIELFEASDEPPYYGSEHLLNFHTVYPDLWSEEERLVGYDKCGPSVKERYADTWYQWCKNGDFAVGYGAIDRPEGTADRAFHKQGSHALLKERFSKKEKLNQLYISKAEYWGYVETLPDRTVDQNRGYPLLCTRTYWGSILPTVPLNYRVQGTACWVLMRAMILAQEYLDELNQHSREQYYLIMQIHDEVVFDFPYKPNKGNLPLIMDIKHIMDSIGYDLIPPVPLPFGIDYHRTSWAESETVV